MRRNGIEIQYRVEVPQIAFLGDTTAGPPANGRGPTIFAFSYYPGPGYQAPTGVYPSAACPGYAPIVSSGSDPHIIHLPAARHRRARKSCN